jgi:hypothetical protein
MEISQSDISFRPDQDRTKSELDVREQWENGLAELKADVTERPFLWLGIAFVAGFVSQMFPVRLFFFVLMRAVSWLSGPVILLMGVVKISDLFSRPRRRGPTILHHP